MALLGRYYIDILTILAFKQTNACNLVLSCTPGQYTGKGHVPVIYVDVEHTK